MDTTLDRSGSDVAAGRAAINRIAVGVDGYPEGSDAVALGAAIARVTDAQLMLVAVHMDPLVVLPEGMDWASLRRQARAALEAARDSLAPGARIDIETGLSVPRALHRVIRRERRDLLVVGSSRDADPGHVRIGKRTRQLLCHFECSLAVAPRGFREQPEASFRRVGVGYDGGPESDAALGVAAAIAVAAGAELRIQTVADDRLRPIGWSTWSGADGMADVWERAVQEEMQTLDVEVKAALGRTGAGGSIEVNRGRPADSLLSLSEQVDLLVIGSRRWGPVSRLLLGSTGEALLHDAACPVLTVPRPPA